MAFQIGDIWYGKNETAYEGIRATIDDITSRYVQVSFTPPLRINGPGLHSKPIGKRQFTRHFEPYQQMTIFDLLNGQ